jgi:outer membrane protein
MLPQVAKDKEEELQNLRTSIDKFQREADQSIQRKQMELLEPVYDKIEKAIRSVATANNYTHIFSDGMGAVSILLYASEDDDVTNLVLKEMGVTPKEAPTAEN